MSEQTVRLCDACEKKLPVITRGGLETSHSLVIEQDGQKYELDACSIAHARWVLQRLHRSKGVR